MGKRKSRVDSRVLPSLAYEAWPMFVCPGAEMQKLSSLVSSFSCFNYVIELVASMIYTGACHAALRLFKDVLVWHLQS